MKRKTPVCTSVDLPYVSSPPVSLSVSNLHHNTPLRSNDERPYTSSSYGWDYIIGNLVKCPSFIYIYISFNQTPFSKKKKKHLSSSAILRNHLVSRLAAVISPKEFQDISENLSSIQQLSAIRIEAVRSAFAVGFNKQMQVLTGFSGAALLASLFLWERDPRVVR